MSKLREQLEISGCTIVENNEKKIVAKCPVDILEKGLRFEGVKSVQTEREDEKLVTLILEKEEE